MTRLVIVYQFFGPYHRARWPVVRALGAANGIDVRGLEVFSRPDLYRWDREATLEGVAALELPTNGSDGLRWRDGPALARAMNAMAPDVAFINGWGTTDALVLHAWCSLHGVPRVVVSDSQASESRDGLREFIKRIVVRGCASAFVGGQPHRRYVQRLGMAPEAVFEGCDVVDNAHFAAAATSRVPGGWRILTVSRLAASKNLLLAGHAFLDFVRTRPRHEGWIWQIAGYGPLQDEMSRLASRSDGRIRLLGAISYEEMPRVLADADLYWQPSVREPWGLAVNEAMASGLPVLVSSRCGCHEDLVSESTGWTFDPADKGAMVDGLERAAARRSEWTTMGKAGMELIGRWGIDTFADGVLQAARFATSSGARTGSH